MSPNSFICSDFLIPSVCENKLTKHLSEESALPVVLHFEQQEQNGILFSLFVIFLKEIVNSIHI